MQEIISKRTRNSKTHHLGGRKFAWDGTIGSIHYSENGEWLEIDNAFEPAIAPWDWQMLKAGYHIRAKEDFTAGQIIEFEKQGESVQLQPMALEWTNDLDQIQQISMPQSVNPVITNPEVDLLPAIGIPSHQGTIRWNDAYGDGLGFEWRCSSTRLIKILKIESFSKLPAPEQYILDGGNPVLGLNLIFAPSSSVDIYVDGEIWGKKAKAQTFNIIEFRKDGEVLWGFMPLRYWGSGDALETNGERSVATLEKRGNKLYISVRVPYEWLQSAVYPVFIDVDVDEQVTASADDGYVYDVAPGWENSDPTGYIGYTADYTLFDLSSYYRFLGVTIPPDALILGAYVSLYFNTAVSGVKSVVKAEDAQTPAQIISKADWTGRARTTAGVNWDDEVTTGWRNSPEIKTVIQELVDTYGYGSGAPMQILHDERGSLSTDLSFTMSWDHGDHSLASKLHIEYTLGLLVSTEAASDILKISATLNGEISALGDGNADERGFVYATQSYGDPEDTAPADSEYNDNGGYVVNETDSFGTGTYSLPLTGLAELTKHYVRAYAHNSLGYAYGDEVYFHTLGSLTGWPYREIVPIAGATGAGTNYSVPVEVYKGEGTNKVGVAYLNNHGTDYPNDIVLTDIDGETKLDHWKTPCEDISTYTVKDLGRTTIDASGNIWGIAGGKVWKSSDGGDSWEEMHSTDYDPTTIFIDSNGNFYGAGDGPSGRGIYRSTDQMENWTKVQSLNAGCSDWGWGGRSFTEITKSGAYQGYLLFGVYSVGDGSELEARIYRSTNDGVDWSQVYPAGAAVDRHVHVCQADPYTGYVYATIGDYISPTGTGMRCIRSIDGGTNWTTLWYNTAYDRPRYHFTGIAFTENYRLFGEDYYAGAVFRTSDDSTLEKLWEPVSETGFVNFMIIARGDTDVDDVLYVGYGEDVSAACIMKALGPHFDLPELLQTVPGSVVASYQNPFPHKLGYLLWGSTDYKLTPGHRFWVEVADDLSSEDGAICIYYGKTGASSESDIKSAFILADDFNDNELDTALWNSGGTISEEASRLKASAEGSSTYLISKDKISGNILAEVKFSEFTCPDTDQGGTRLIAKVDSNNQAYAQRWHTDTYGGRMWGMIYKGGGLEDEGYETVTPSLGWFKIIRVGGDDIRVYTRRQESDWVLQATADAMWSGDLDILLQTYSTDDDPPVSVYLDTVIVRKYVSPEPVVGTPRSEQVLLPPILPPTATSTSEALAPTILTGIEVLAVTAEATSEALPPVVPHVEIFATTAVATSEALVPILPNATIIGVTATADSEALSPVIRISYNVAAEVAEATSEAIVPAVTTGEHIEIIAPTAESTSEALVPTIAAAVDVVAVTATADSEALAPTILAVQNVDITAVTPTTADGVALAPTITTTWAVDVIAPIATADSEAVAPTISAITNVDISAVVAQATSEALAPEITASGDALVVAVTATADSQAIAPTIELLIEILAVTATADSLAIVPAIATTWSIEILAAVATADSQAYAVAILAQKNINILALTALADSLALPSVYAGRDLIGLTFTRPYYDAKTFTRKVWDAKTFTK